VTSDGTRRRCRRGSPSRHAEPIDFEGTYPLPEAQLDRFLLKIRVSYPSEQDEYQILSAITPGRPA